MGRAAYRLLRRRSGTDLSGGALRGRLPRLDARAGQALARGAGTRSRPGRGGRDSLQRAGGHALHAPRRTGDARRAAARGRHGPAFSTCGPTPRRCCSSRETGSWRCWAATRRTLTFWRMLRIAGHPDVRLLEFDGYDHGNMPQAGHPPPCATSAGGAIKYGTDDECETDAMGPAARAFRGGLDGLFAAEGGGGHGRSPLEGGDERKDDDPRVLLRHGGRGGAGRRLDHRGVGPSGGPHGGRAVEDTGHARRSDGRHAEHSRRGDGRPLDSLPPHERGASPRPPTRCCSERRATSRGETAARLDRRAARLAGRLLPAERYALMERFVDEFMRDNPVTESDGADNTTLAWLEFLPGERCRAGLCRGVDRRGAGRRERPREWPDAAGSRTVSAGRRT